MTFATPLALLALVALPLLWWLLRVTPPAPRREVFPGIFFLSRLPRAEETPAHTPWWLLALRALAAMLAVVGLARPVLNSASGIAGTGPIMVIIDNGWTAAGDWPRRIQAANAILDRAAAANRPVALIATAAAGTDGARAPVSAAQVSDVRPRLGALAPEPWPSDRAAAVPDDWRTPGTDVFYIGDGTRDSSDPSRFAAKVKAIGAVTEICCGAPPHLILPPESGREGFRVNVARGGTGAGETVTVQARTGDGMTLASATVAFAPGAGIGAAAMDLPVEIRNKIARLTIAGAPSAGAVYLLDERTRRRPVGLLTTGVDATDTPLSGAFFFLKTALAPFAELREGDLPALTRGELSVLIMPDRTLTDGPEAVALRAWVEKGGLLIRFSGPHLAEEMTSDPLLPVPLLNGDRQLGGAMSWSEPAGLAPFPAASPFAGLAVPADVHVTRQVLAEPGADLARQTWASLVDGTPLVTRRALGQGQIVLFHVTSNADWSDLPLSGLYVEMLNRLIALSAGTSTVADSTILAPADMLDGFGGLVRPPPSARGLEASAFPTTAPSPIHPPGLYGPEAGRRALNVGTASTMLEAIPRLPGATQQPLGDAEREREIGPGLLAFAFVLLILDLLISLRLRGALRLAGAVLVLFGLHLGTARAADAPDSNPALVTRLGYIDSGEARVNAVSRAGLAGLSDYVNRRTAAMLAKPDEVDPDSTDLSVYPLLYWPVGPDARELSAHAVAALNDFMARGGILVIDTGTGRTSATGGAQPDPALRRVTRGLSVPALTPLTNDNVLARSFYLLTEFPGRFESEPVWVQKDPDRSNDGVSSIIIGSEDWATAWAVDGFGRNLFPLSPGGERQRTLAYRFGVNLVMYALTGNYKGDQVHIPAIMKRLGQ
jgi:Domain of unknown function (DUF4159)/Aerotolerance regulator N-terminal